MGEPLAADFLSNRAVELCPEKLIEFRTATIERIGDLRCADGFTQMGADEQKCVSDRRVGNGDDIRRAPCHDPFWWDEDCPWMLTRFFRFHQPVKKCGGLITAAFEILVDGGKRNGLIFADKGIVAD